MPGKILENRFEDTRVPLLEYFRNRKFCLEAEISIQFVHYPLCELRKFDIWASACFPTHHFGKISFDFVIQFPKTRGNKLGSVIAQSL